MRCTERLARLEQLCTAAELDGVTDYLARKGWDRAEARRRLELETLHIDDVLQSCGGDWDATRRQLAAETGHTVEELMAGARAAAEGRRYG